MDAISWRRLTSIVKSDLLSPKSEKSALAEVTLRTGDRYWITAQENTA
jgi:hypothetical protein